MTKALLVGDVHLSDRPPSSCTDSYTDDMFDLLYEVAAIASKHNVDYVLQGGDFFHIRTPSRTSHALVMRAIDWARSVSCPVHVVIGNHDLSNGDRLESIHETQPLGIVFASEAIKELNAFTIPDLNVYGIPWQQDWEEEGTIERVFSPVKGKGALVVTHAPLYPPGKELPYEHILASEVADAMGNTGQVFYSHVHDYHGIFEVNGVTFCNQGALSRGSLHESDLTRKIRVTLWDSETGEFTPLDVPHKPGTEVFRVAEHQELKDSELRLDEFLDRVGSVSLEITSIEAVIQYIEAMDNVEDDVRKLAKVLLQEATS